MGKFHLEKFEEKEALQKKQKQTRMREALQLKPLLKVEPKNAKGSKVEDGILLFGKYSGQKVSALLNMPDTSAYVVDYLSKSKDLPKKFRDDIDTIIQNLDPWSEAAELGKFSGLTVREVLDPDDNIPW